MCRGQWGITPPGRALCFGGDLEARVEDWGDGGGVGMALLPGCSVLGGEGLWWWGVDIWTR